MSSATIFELPAITPEEEAEMEREMLENALDTRARVEARSPAGRRVVWLTAAPSWAAGAWLTFWEMADAVAEARGWKLRDSRHRYAFPLPSGGDLAVTVHRTKPKHDDRFPDRFPISGCRLEITAASPSGTYRVELDSTVCEMNDEYLVLPAATPDALAREIADTLHRIDSAEALLALRKPGNRCVVCRRPLKDQVSRVLELGPDCAGHLGIPHNTETVARVFAIRAKGQG